MRPSDISRHKLSFAWVVDETRLDEKVDPRSRMAISYRGSTHSKVQSENKEIDLEEG